VRGPPQCGNRIFLAGPPRMYECMYVCTAVCMYCMYIHTENHSSLVALSSTLTCERTLKLLMKASLELRCSL
jgi:hypothetical protein